jgi:hypothetical protein
MSLEHRWNAVEEGEELTYKAFCLRAGIAFALGLLAPTVFIHKGLSVFAIGAVLVAASALRAIAKNPDRLTGRLFSHISLLIAIVSLTAVAVDDYLYWRSVESGAIEVANEFFANLQADEPQRALQLKSPVWLRTESASPEELMLGYLDGPLPFELLVEFTSQSEIRNILALGDKADIRLYRVSEKFSDAEFDGVQLVYAVTYDKSALTPLPEEDEEFHFLGTAEDADEDNVFNLVGEDELHEDAETQLLDELESFELEPMGLQTYFVGVVVKLYKNPDLKKKSWVISAHEEMNREGIFLSDLNVNE